MTKQVLTSKILEERDPARPAAEELTVSDGDVRGYLAALRKKGLGESTQKTYRRKLMMFFRFIQPGGRVGPDTVEAWARWLEAKYSAATVNMCLSVVNGFLEWLGRRDLQWLDRLEKAEKRQPELNRQEYRSLLHAAIDHGDEEDYLLIKTFAATGLFSQEIDKLTVEAVRQGRVDVVSNGVAQSLRVPPSLRQELLSYAERRGIRSGSVFRTKSGNPLRRGDVSIRTRRICGYAGLPCSKGTARSLRKLYIETRRGIEAELSALMEQTYDRLLEMEQESVGWPEKPGNE